MRKILIIEDERPMTEAIKFNLEKEGFDVDVALNGQIGWEMFEGGAYDLVLLDLMLPGMDGMEICRKVRQKGTTSIIMLTAKDSDVDKILGLEMGADDYVTKPFNMRELLARIKAIFRRHSSEPKEAKVVFLEGGDIIVNTERHEVKVRGEVVEMPLMEYRLLETFLKKPGKVLPRDYLIARVWEGDFYGSSKTLDVHISRLREKIEKNSVKPEHIITIRGVGYRFEVGG